MSPGGQALPGGPRVSLRTRLIRHVGLLLLLTWSLGSALALGIASYFTQQAFDRTMLDDAHLLAAHLARRGARTVLNMSSDDIQTVLYDQTERVYFSITGPDGELIAGHTGLEPPPAAADTEWYYTDLHHDGRHLRAVVLEQADPRARIVVALTTTSRQALLGQLVLFSLTPQALLLLALTLGLRRLISRDLRPLSSLQGLLDARDAADLSALPAALLNEAGSRDVHGLARAIDALFRRVAQGIAAQREFAGNVAHELRTPLAGIRALAEYGLAQHDPARWREQLQAVLQAQQRASRLVDQLLAVALADESRGAIELRPLDLSAIAREQLLRLLPDADRAGLVLEAFGLETPAWVRAEASLLDGLLANLLDNALRYGHAGRGEGRIWIELQRGAGTITLSVCDDGPGMTDGQRESLTERWRQGPGGSALGVGAGLGLAIVRRYAELLQARFELAPGAQGRGLRASLCFAAHEPEAAPAAPQSSGQSMMDFRVQRSAPGEKP